jgi:hypothetical protein
VKTNELPLFEFVGLVFPLRSAGLGDRRPCCPPGWGLLAAGGLEFKILSVEEKMLRIKQKTMCLSQRTHCKISFPPL